METIHPRPRRALTERERRFLRLAAQGLSNKQVAAELGIGHGAVRNALSAVYAKLGAANRAHAVVLWLREHPGDAG